MRALFTRLCQWLGFIKPTPQVEEQTEQEIIASLIVEEEAIDTESTVFATDPPLNIHKILDELAAAASPQAVLPYKTKHTMTADGGVSMVMNNKDVVRIYSKKEQQKRLANEAKAE